mmetsp:Transcript_48754/g.155886  ORF Transcript_48754/g.155886 Transcript_48754/m.155886 type:complete len:252 (-) Transcript_48754:355-1110(-)
MERPAELHAVAALGAVGAGRHDARHLKSRALLDVVASGGIPHVLHEESLTLHALVDYRRLGGVVLGARWGVEDTHKDADVEVDGAAHQRPRLPPVLGRRGGHRVQQQPQGHLVHVARLQRRAAVPREARLRVVAPEHGHVRGGHAQHAPVGDGLHRRVQEGGRGAVGVQVDDVVRVLAEAPRASRPAGVHVAVGVLAGDLDAVARHVVVRHVLPDVRRGPGVDVVRDDESHTLCTVAELLCVADGPDASGG